MAYSLPGGHQIVSQSVVNSGEQPIILPGTDCVENAQQEVRYIMDLDGNQFTKQ